jgi:hypothetical protein
MFTWEAAEFEASAGVGYVELVDVLFWARMFCLEAGRIFFAVLLLPPPEVMRLFCD